MAYRGGVATDPLGVGESFSAAVERVRNEVTMAGEDKAPAAGEYVSPFDADEREAIMRLLRDGTYHRAAARVGEEDPELSDQ